MPNLAYPPCLRPGCKSPSGHPNCRCFSNISTENLEQQGYQRPGSTLGLKRRNNPDGGKSWYAGPGNGQEGLPPKTPDQQQGQSSAGKFIQAGKWAINTLGKIGSTFFADGGEVGPHHNAECHHFASGGEVEQLHEFMNNPDLAIDHSIISHGLLHLLTKTGHSKSEDPSRVMNDHLEHARAGRKELENHSKNIFEKGDRVDVGKDHVDALKAHLDDLQENPHKALDVGGSLYDSLPGHAAAVAGKTAAVLNHFKLIKPKAHQPNPLSDPIAPSRMEENQYQRQLAIAQNPASVYNHVKSGTVEPGDMQTIQAIYPKLYSKMANQTTGALIEAKTNGTELSRKHKMGLGAFLGQPLGYVQSPEAMQAIIAANGPQQTPQQQGQKSKRSGATAAELKQLNKVDDMYRTPLEQTKSNQKA
jgi:hypothetical protein